jgi:hypothetical protein
VCFVQVYCGDTNDWDAHADIVGNHDRRCGQSDLPITGLLCDLKSRGLPDETRWSVGRVRPHADDRGGQRPRPQPARLHDVLAGGVKGGQALGAADAVGLRAAENRTHVHDVQATIFYLLGLNHVRLTFRHNGRNERLTESAGDVIEPALA